MIPDVSALLADSAPKRNYKPRPKLEETVHEMRKTTEGRKQLAALGKSKDVPTGALGSFVAWDGEGVTQDGRHDYVLMGNSYGQFLRARKGQRLGTKAILRLMLRAEAHDPKAIHVAYGFTYDAEKILSDIPMEWMTLLYEEKVFDYDGYRIQYYPRKWFQVSGNHEGKRYTCRIWDIVGFFQQPFIDALRNLFGDHKDFRRIESGKVKRNVFTYDELDRFIIPYWNAELEWMVKMAEHLRTLLHRADMPISQWHGPGAIASYLFKKNGIKRHMDKEIPENVGSFARLAFAGGRFEPFTIGRAGRPIYQYDINSAHPSGMAKLPSLATGEWVPVTRVGEVSEFGIYDISYDAIGESEEDEDSVLAPQPFFHRNKKGEVRYGMRLRNCYWQPEILAAQATGHKFHIHRGFELDHSRVYPFEFIHDMYRQRQEWKSQTPPEAAQMALKLGLNSLFGKTAQRIGWTPKNQQIPAWHQIEWAGYITSNTRAILWEALWKAWQKGSLVSVDTDAVFSTEPLDLPCGKALGEWEYDLWDDMVYLQNGIYWLKRDGKWKAKFRGLDKDSITVDDALRFFDSMDFRERWFKDYGYDNPYKIEAYTTRFISSRFASHVNHPEARGQWQKCEHVVSVGTEGKRIHVPNVEGEQWTCYACDPYVSPAEKMHDLTHDMPRLGQSVAHNIPWIETDAANLWGFGDDEDELLGEGTA